MILKEPFLQSVLDLPGIHRALVTVLTGPQVAPTFAALGSIKTVYLRDESPHCFIQRDLAQPF